MVQTTTYIPVYGLLAYIPDTIHAPTEGRLLGKMEKTFIWRPTTRSALLSPFCPTATACSETHTANVLACLDHAFVSDTAGSLFSSVSSTIRLESRRAHAVALVYDT